MPPKNTHAPGEVAYACAQCGATFWRYPSHRKPGRPYCSAACFQAAHTTLRAFTCERCGKPFTRKASYLARVPTPRFCTGACRYATLAEARQVLPCPVCGKPFSVKPHRIAEGARWCSPECAGIARRYTAANFWSQVQQTGPDDCWEWTGRRDRAGYGLTQFDRTTVRTHRLAYELTFGKIPDELVVMHRCDFPPCCNPAHLTIGMPADNVADRNAKGRQVKGERCHTSRLTPADVRVIRCCIAAGENVTVIAARYGVVHGTIWHIAQGRSWKWLT